MGDEPKPLKGELENPAPSGRLGGGIINGFKLDVLACRDFNNGAWLAVMSFTASFSSIVKLLNERALQVSAAYLVKLSLMFLFKTSS